MMFTVFVSLLLCVVGVRWHHGEERVFAFNTTIVLGAQGKFDAVPQSKVRSHPCAMKKQSVDVFWLSRMDRAFVCWATFSPIERASKKSLQSWKRNVWRTHNLWSYRLAVSAT
jgi:hypothetical protein